jgi:hypothetical protein
MRIILGIFFVLHGLVHMLYFGQSIRQFELSPGLLWPDGSWAFTKLIGDEGTRLLAGIACVLAAVGFVTGGAALFASQAWWRPIIIASAAFSAVIYILLWDGGFQRLADKGGVGILINLVILSALLVLKWPKFDF